MKSFTLFCGYQPPITLAPPPPPPDPISDRPTLALLQQLTTPSGGSINIIQRIGQESHILGILLLNDTHGNITANIERQYKHDQCRITEEIFHKWLNGTGRTPQSWATFVTKLREIGMAALAHEIEQNMAQ